MLDLDQIRDLCARMIMLEENGLRPYASEMPQIVEALVQLRKMMEGQTHNGVKVDTSHDPDDIEFNFGPGVYQTYGGEIIKKS